MKQRLVSIVASVLSVLTVTTAPFAASAAEKPADYTIKDCTTAESFYSRVVLSKASKMEDKVASPVYGDFNNNLLFDLAEENFNDGNFLKSLNEVKDGESFLVNVYTPNGSRVLGRASGTGRTVSS